MMSWYDRMRFFCENYPLAFKYIGEAIYKGLTIRKLRVKKFEELKAPEVIIANEKRQIQRQLSAMLYFLIVENESEGAITGKQARYCEELLAEDEIIRDREEENGTLPQG